jgi:tRNA1(Val) A37 N6-methylase TrmN6
MELTEDTLLGGRVRLRQTKRGLRAGLDAVMLAAGVSAKPGETVLEAGAGTGAAILCLMARVPGLHGVAVERDPALCDLLRENAMLNGARLTVIEGDIADPAVAARLPRCDRALANPPYWPKGTRPPDPLRAGATHEADVPLEAWVRFCARALRRGGSVTIILPSARLSDGVSAMRAAGCGGIWLRALQPLAGASAKRIVLCARVGSRAPDAVLPGVALHAAGGGWTEGAAALLEGRRVLFWSYPGEPWSVPVPSA